MRKILLLNFLFNFLISDEIDFIHEGWDREAYLYKPSCIPNDIPDDFLAGYMAAGGDKLLKNDKGELKGISDELNIPITYYENLYSDDRMAVFELINKWDLDIDPFDMLDYLDPSKKLKQIDKKSVI